MELALAPHETDGLKTYRRPPTQIQRSDESYTKSFGDYLNAKNARNAKKISATRCRVRSQPYFALTADPSPLPPLPLSFWARFRSLYIPSAILPNSFSLIPSATI